MRISDWSSDVCSSDLLSLIIFREPTPADFTIAFVGLCLCAYSAITFYRDDQKIRAIAQLTPIYDMAALRAQVGVLNSTVALLSDALQFGDPADLKSTRLNSSHYCASCMPYFACTKT